MNLARFSVNRPVAASIISFTIFVLGAYSLAKIPVSLYPEVNAPYVSATIPLPGASAEQVEQKIVKPLEKELVAVRGQKRIFSYIRNGGAIIVSEFHMNVNPREAVDNVREKVAKLRATFPKDTKEPVVSRVDLGATPVLIYGIDSKKSPAAIKKYLDDFLIRDLQTTEGVSEAEVVGIGDEQVEVNLKPDKLASLRIAPLDVFQQLATYATTIPWGDLHGNTQIFKVSRSVLSQDPAFWTKYLLTLADGRSVRLGEIGTVRIINDPDASTVHINGQPGLGLIITKRADANTVETARLVKKVISRMAPDSGIKLFSLIDQSHHIDDNVHEVWIALIVGGLFAVLVILLFLTDVKSALITATALPISVSGTFIFLYYLGFSINMMTLIALALAIGLLIDDAVVVRESIFSLIEKGVSAREAAISGTDKVANAVLATSLAVIAVFLPIRLMTGVVGQFFKEFGATIIIAVTLSLWVAFTLDPMLSAKFAGVHSPLAGRFWDKWRSILNSMERGAGNLAGKAFHRPMLVIVIAVVLLAVSLGLALRRGSDFLALEDRGSLLVTIVAPVGSTKQTSTDLIDEAYKRLQGLKGFTDLFAEIKGDDVARSELRVVFVTKNHRRYHINDLVREVKKRLTGLKAEVLVNTPPFIEGVGLEAQLTVYIYGDDFGKLYHEADRFLPKLRAIAGVSGMILDTERAAPGYGITLNQTEAGFYSTNATAVELTGRIALTGLEAGAVGDDNLSLIVRYPESQRSLNQLWQKTYVPTPKGPILLSALASAKENFTPTTITREKRSRKIVLHGVLDHTRSFGNVARDAADVLSTIEPPMRFELAGDKSFFDEMTTALTIAIIGSVFFIFVILAIQFENLLRPFIIILTLPLAVIGGLFALYFTDNNLALGSAIGLILLIGLASKNGILLVDLVGKKEKTLDLALSVREATTERFRPIIMTSVTMVFGMLPTAFMRGGGSETRAPMAIAIIGGVVSSTLLSLVIVPAIFGLIAKFRGRNYVSESNNDNLDKVISVMGVLLVAAASFTLCADVGYAARGLATPTGQDGAPRLADMQKVIRILNTDPRSESKEAFINRAATEAAEGLSTSSVLAFLGGVKMEAQRQWDKPGIYQDTSIPLPPMLGGPQTIRTTIVPTWQNTYTIGWTLPLFNMQAIEALTVAAQTRHQEQAIKALERETFARTKTQLILEYELVLKAAKLQDERVDVAKSRLSTVKARTLAGLGRAATEEEATASLAAAMADRERTISELDRLRVTFRAHSGLTLPNAGFGLPQFPMNSGGTFDPVALKVLSGMVKIKESSRSVYNAAFVPTVDLSLAHEIIKYEPNPPDAQNIAVVKLSWTLLDAGTRRHNVSDATREMYQAAADFAGAQLELKTAFDTLKTRTTGAQHNLAARVAALHAARQAVNDAMSAFRSGMGRLLDVRTADEIRLGAELGVYQAQLELQAIAVESLVLSGRFLDYLARGTL